MEQNVITYKINLFSRMQKIEVFHSAAKDGGVLECVYVTADELVDTIFALAQKHNVDTIFIKGSKFHKEKYIQDIQTKELQLYNQHKLKFL